MTAGGASAASDRRHTGSDRRANRRGGRRAGDAGRPWYMRRPLWLALASITYVGWRRLFWKERS